MSNELSKLIEDSTGDEDSSILNNLNLDDMEDDSIDVDETELPEDGIDYVELFDEDEDEDDEEIDEIDLEEDDEEENSGNTFTVKVDGEVFEVTEKELKDGYQRQADYTREKQMLKAQIEEFETEKEEVSEQLSAISELDMAWEENPTAVITQFTASTDNPTQVVAELIRELAAANLLEQQFLDIFGITPDIQAEWRKDSELNSLRSSNQRVEKEKEQQNQSAQEKVEIQKAIADYDRQIDEIIEGEGYEFSSKQRQAFRSELAAYAADNELTNLKAAYKAFKYEESVKRKKLAAKTVEKAKAKKATKVVSRSGAGEGTPIADTSDLNSLIRQAMKEAGN